MRRKPQVLCGLRISALLLLYSTTPNCTEQKITDPPWPFKSAQTLLKYSFFVTHQNLVPGRGKLVLISLHRPQLPLPGGDGFGTQQSSQASIPTLWAPQYCECWLQHEELWWPAADNLVSLGESCPDWPLHFWKPEARLSRKTRENSWTFKDSICFQQQRLCCNNHGSRCILSCFCASKEPQRLFRIMSYQVPVEMVTALFERSVRPWIFPLLFQKLSRNIALLKYTFLFLSLNEFPSVRS